MYGSNGKALQLHAAYKLTTSHTIDKNKYQILHVTCGASEYAVKFT